MTFDTESPTSGGERKQQKKSFSPKQASENKNIQNKRNILKFLGWLFVTPLVLVGHFYCAIFIFWSASYFYKEVISMFRVLRKDKEIALNWLDWFWYGIGAYVCLPYAFNRNKIYTIESKTIQIIFYQYHALFC